MLLYAVLRAVLGVFLPTIFTWPPLSAVLRARLRGSFFGARDKKAEELFRGVPLLPGDHVYSTA